MALVPCPECKALVSRAATSCPQCGFPFGGATVPGVGLPGAAAPLAPASEEVLWEGNPSLKSMLAAAITTALYAIVVPVGAYLLYGFLHDSALHGPRDVSNLVRENEDNLRTGFILVVALIVGSRLVRLVWRGLALRSHHYRVSNQRIVVESGVFSKSLAEIDVRTVDDITFHQSFVERLLGIGQIAILSSDPSNARVRLLGVPDPRQVRELIRSSAYQATRGQLFTRAT